MAGTGRRGASRQHDKSRLHRHQQQQQVWKVRSADPDRHLQPQARAPSPPSPSPEPVAGPSGASTSQPQGPVPAGPTRGEEGEVGRLLEDSLRLEGGEKEEEEVVLSEEPIRINDQLQADEVLALEAIYGDNISVLERHKGLRSFQMHVHIDLPQNFTVSVCLDSPTGRFRTESKFQHEADANGNLADFFYNFKVQHLPPIIFTCVFPRSYPSSHPPHFTINIEWLDKERISSLCRVLDTIWEQQSGQEVIYQWIEWLQNSSLSYLGFDTGMTLSPCGISTSTDRRAISRKISHDSYIPTLMSYNDEKCHESFLSNLHGCLICFNEYPG